MAQRIGFAGLGIMGRGMAKNLLKAGYELTVYNRTRKSAEDLAALGAKVAETPADAARGNNVVITMLADPPAIESAVLGKGGVIEGLESGAILIDCSTVDPATTAAIAEAASANGAKFLDSPVAGSKDAAAKGELILMVGGEESVLEEVRPILEVVSSKIVYAGKSGLGTMLKLCFNLTVAHMTSAMSQALVLGVKSGLKPETIIETLMAGAIGCRFFEWKGGAIMDRDFATNFSLKLMHKDLHLVLNAGYTHNVPLPVVAAVEELFAMAKAHGEGEEDFCSVIKVLEDLAGVEVRRR
ncbi:MAG: NAD(P)-dependent oxidoreductase [Armatimonadota bacterium]|nr:NAD(P)-dependent oxidoreductase [Armatimonadota bacterium]